MGAGHPDLFRAGRRLGLPVDRVGDGLAHLGEPPLGALHAGFPPSGAANLAAIESEFELLIGRHNMPFL